MAALTRWYVLLTMMMVYTLSIADRYVISTVLEPIKSELKLTDSGIGFLTGVALALFYLFFSFPIAWLMDRKNRRNLIAVSIALWSCITVCSGLSRNYSQLLLTRFGVGIGEAGATPGANSLLSDFFVPGRRAMALTVFSLGAPLGAWLGADFAGAISDRYGWRSAFIALGIPGIVVSLLIVLTIREPRRGRYDSDNRPAAASFGECLVALRGSPAAMHLIAACGLTTLWGWGLMWWTPAYLMRSYYLSAGAAGAVIGPIHLFGGVAATLCTGWIVALPQMAESRRVLWLLGAVLIVGTLASIALFTAPTLARSVWLFWIFIPSIYLYIGPGFGILNNLAEPRMRAMYCSISLFVSNVGNLVIAPQLIGMLSDRFAYPHPADAESLRVSLLCLAPTGFWAAFHYMKCAGHLKTNSAKTMRSTT